MNKKLVSLIIFALILLGIVILLNVSEFGTKFVWDISNGGKWLLPLITISALIDSINPCAFSILLLTIAFLVSVGKMRSSILKIGGTYILGIFVIYMLIGLGILQTLHIFNTPHFMAKVGATLMILFGIISLIGHFWPNFPIKLRIPQSSHQKMAELIEKSSVPTAFILGALVGLCEFPCTGGPYLMALGLLHDQSTYLSGFGYLLLYNLIFVLPLVIVLFIASDGNLLSKVETWKKEETGSMRLFGGIAMILLGLIVFAL